MTEPSALPAPAAPAVEGGQGAGGGDSGPAGGGRSVGEARTRPAPLAAARNGAKGELSVLNRRRGCDDALEPAPRPNHADRLTPDATTDAVEASLPGFRRYPPAKEQLLGNWDRFIAEKGIRAEDYVNPCWRPRGLPEHTLPAAKRQVVDAEWSGDEQVVGRNWKKHHGAEQAV